MFKWSHLFGFIPSFIDHYDYTFVNLLFICFLICAGLSWLLVQIPAITELLERLLNE